MSVGKLFSKTILVRITPWVTILRQVLPNCCPVKEGSNGEDYQRFERRFVDKKVWTEKV